MAEGSSGELLTSTRVNFVSYFSFTWDQAFVYLYKTLIIGILSLVTSIGETYSAIASLQWINNQRNAIITSNSSIQWINNPKECNNH